MANEFKVKNGIKFPDDTIQTTAATGGGSTVTFNNITAAYTVVAGDLGKVINCTSGTFTVSLTAAATLGSGFNCWVWNTGTGTITIIPNGSETIDSISFITLRQGEGTQIVCNGINWEIGDKKTMRGYAENIASSATRPVASGLDSIAVGKSTTSTGTYSTSVGYQTTATQTGAVALGYNATAASSYSVAVSGYAAATYSVAIGGNSGGSFATTSSGGGAVALGGSYASGADSFAAAVANNTSTYGATAANNISLGYLSKSTGIATTAIGYTANSSGYGSTAFGYGAVASANNSTAIGGNWSYGAPTASSQSTIAIGDGATADSDFATALGNAAITNGVVGKYAYSNGRFSANGDSQLGTYILRRSTTGSTSTGLTVNNTLTSTSNHIILPNNTAFAFSAMVVARQQASGGTQSAAWKIEGLIRREGSASTTTLVNSATTVISNAPGWSLSASANTTWGSLNLIVAGATSTNIRWVATVQTSEVTYA